MMEVVRTWLIGIVGAALIAAVAENLSPEGTVKKIGKMVSGLLLMTAILNPLLPLDYAVLASEIVTYKIDSETYSAALETENQRLMKTIIEEQTSAYIQDKASDLGIVCTAEVLCSRDDSSNLYPESAIIYGKLSLEQTNTLCKLVEGDLAIPAQNLHFERETEE